MWPVSSQALARGVYIWIQKRYLFPALLQKLYFPPFCYMVFWLTLCPFYLNSSPFCICLTLLLPIFSFLSFFPFLPFSLTYSSFFFPFLYFSSNGICWYPPPQEGGIFQYIDPCHENSLNFLALLHYIRTFNGTARSFQVCKTERIKYRAANSNREIFCIRDECSVNMRIFLGRSFRTHAPVH